MKKLPFRYGQVVTGEYFCGRKQLVEQVKTYVEAGQNIVLQGERRVGKTSLVMEATRHLKGRRLLRASLLSVKTPDALCKTLLEAMLQLERSGSMFERLSKTLSHLHPKFEINPYTGAHSVSFSSQTRLEPKTVPEILSLIASIHEQRPLVMFLDEFQDILTMDEGSEQSIALFREAIQHQGDLPCIFAGSIRNQMDAIFNHPKSPFFKAAIPLGVEPLELDEFGPFLQQRFKKTGRTAPRPLVEKIYELCDRIPGDIQHLCDALWVCSSEGDTLGEDHLHEAFKLVFARERKSYEHILAELPAGSVRILQALARVGGETVTGQGFVREAAVSNASAITQALPRMEKKGIIWDDGRQWRFTNPFFRAYLLS